MGRARQLEHKSRSVTITGHGRRARSAAMRGNLVVGAVVFGGTLTEDLRDGRGRYAGSGNPRLAICSRAHAASWCRPSSVAICA